MKIKYLIAVLIILVGAVLAGGVLFFPNFLGSELTAAKQNPQWTQNAGLGVSVPACSSADAIATCSPDGTSSVTFSWSYGGQHGACGWVTISVGGVPTYINQPCSGSVTGTGAASNTTYSYLVQFVNTDGSAFVDSYEGSFTTPNCAPLPGDFSLSLGGSATCNSVPLSWTASSDADNYRVTRAKGPNNFIFGVISPYQTALNFTDTSVSQNRIYQYQIEASNSTGTRLSNVISIITPNCVPPPPGGFNLSLGGVATCNSMPLSWTVAPGADGYRILRGSPRVDISPYQPYTALNFTDTSVSQNTTYQYQVEAYNGGGTNRSNEINPTTPYCSPTLDFSGNPTSIFEGRSTTLTWSSFYTTFCTASAAWSGAKAINGSEVVIPSPPPSATYTLTCTGPGGSTGPQSVVINITPLALPEWKEIIPR